MKTIFTLLTFIFFISINAYASDVPKIQCSGTEPFWDISINESGVLSLGDPSNGDEKIYSRTILKSMERTSSTYTLNIEARDEANGLLNLNVQKEICDDGMSEEIYPYSVSVNIKGRIFKGCCNL